MLRSKSTKKIEEIKNKFQKVVGRMACCQTEQDRQHAHN